MPQKAVLSRLPLMDARYSALSRGQVRTDARELAELYQALAKEENDPVTWEALFSLACLTTAHPMEEAVSGRILNAMGKTENGAFPVETDQQLPAARAVLAVYEYTATREILKRLAAWCRWLEADWDKVQNRRWVRVQSADLMEFLVRFYRITGLKAMLRLCAKLRSAAMDWTTILHSFQRRSILNRDEMEPEAEALFSKEEYPEIDLFATQYLAGHAELLADGVRYTAFSAMYSGNGQEITAGEKGWEYMKKYHTAACGGTTGDVFLAGSGTEKGIHPAATAAWAEALTAQARLNANPRMMTDLVRLVYNALADCLNQPGTACRVVNIQDAAGKVFCFDPEKDPARDTRILARLARAAALVWQNAIGVSAEGIQLNYLLPGRYMVSTGGENAVLLAERDALHIRCRQPAGMTLDVFCAGTETAEIALQCGNGPEKPAETGEMTARGGGMLRIRRTWDNLDTLVFHQKEKIYTEETHHRGLCIMIRNRVMALNVQDAEYRYAACGAPFIRNGQAFVPVQRIARWPAKDGIPTDIPVLPAGIGDVISAPLTPYAETPGRIAVFPVTASCGTAAAETHV